MQCPGDLYAEWRNTRAYLFAGSPLISSHCQPEHLRQLAGARPAARGRCMKGWDEGQDVGRAERTEAIDAAVSYLLSFGA